MQSFYAGNGWYSDGHGPCFEYYNAWTIHALVSDIKIKNNLIYIKFYNGEEIYSQIGEWKDIFVTLKGKKIAGRVQYARADVNGRIHAIKCDGTILEY